MGDKDSDGLLHRDSLEEALLDINDLFSDFENEYTALPKKITKKYFVFPDGSIVKKKRVGKTELTHKQYAWLNSDEGTFQLGKLSRLNHSWDYNKNWKPNEWDWQYQEGTTLEDRVQKNLDYIKSKRKSKRNMLIRGGLLTGTALALLFSQANNLPKNLESLVTQPASEITSPNYDTPISNGTNLTIGGIVFDSYSNPFNGNSVEQIKEELPFQQKEERIHHVREDRVSINQNNNQINYIFGEENDGVNSLLGLANEYYPDEDDYTVLLNVWYENRATIENPNRIDDELNISLRDGGYQNRLQFKDAAAREDFIRLIDELNPYDVVQSFYDVYERNNITSGTEAAREFDQNYANWARAEGGWDLLPSSTVELQTPIQSPQEVIEIVEEENQTYNREIEQTSPNITVYSLENNSGSGSEGGILMPWITERSEVNNRVISGSEGGILMPWITERSEVVNDPVHVVVTSENSVTTAPEIGEEYSLSNSQGSTAARGIVQEISKYIYDPNWRPIIPQERNVTAQEGFANVYDLIQKPMNGELETYSSNSLTLGSLMEDFYQRIERTVALILDSWEIQQARSNNMSQGTTEVTIVNIPYDNLLTQIEPLNINPNSNINLINEVDRPNDLVLDSIPQSIVGGTTIQYSDVDTLNSGSEGGILMPWITERSEENNRVISGSEGGILMPWITERSEVVNDPVHVVVTSENSVTTAPEIGEEYSLSNSQGSTAARGIVQEIYPNGVGIGINIPGGILNKIEGYEFNFPGSLSRIYSIGELSGLDAISQSVEKPEIIFSELRSDSIVLNVDGIPQNDVPLVSENASLVVPYVRELSPEAQAERDYQIRRIAHFQDYQEDAHNYALRGWINEQELGGRIDRANRAFARCDSVLEQIDSGNWVYEGIDTNVPTTERNDEPLQTEVYTIPNTITGVRDSLSTPDYSSVVQPETTLVEVVNVETPEDLGIGAGAQAGANVLSEINIASSYEATSSVEIARTSGNSLINDNSTEPVIAGSIDGGSGGIDQYNLNSTGSTESGNDGRDTYNSPEVRYRTDIDLMDIYRNSNGSLEAIIDPMLSETERLMDYRIQIGSAEDRTSFYDVSGTFNDNNLLTLNLQNLNLEPGSYMAVLSSNGYTQNGNDIPLPAEVTIEYFNVPETMPEDKIQLDKGKNIVLDLKNSIEKPTINEFGKIEKLPMEGMTTYGTGKAVTWKKMDVSYNQYIA